MLFNLNKVVLKKKEAGLVYDNVSYFIKKYVSDCCICLQYPRDSVLTECNHAFCRECLKETAEYSEKCPICAVPLQNVFSVKLVLLEDIREYICFRRVPPCDSAEYFSFPFLSVYSLESPPFRPGKMIYQSRDGQPYFLSERTVRKIKKDKAPEYIYGRIRSIRQDPGREGRYIVDID